MERTVLVVEDDEDHAHRLRAGLEAEGFAVRVAGDGEEALALARESAPSVILSDVLMPRLDGFALCSRVRRDERLAHIPVVLATTARSAEDSRAFALDVGADDFVDKDLPPRALADLLERRIEAAAGARVNPGVLDADSFHRVHGRRLLDHSVHEAEALRRERDALAEMHLGTLRALVESLDLRDTGTPRHSERVGEYAMLLAGRLGLSPWDRGAADLVRAAMLCDIGNLLVPDRVLRKKGALSAADRRHLRAHPEVASRALAQVEGLRDVADIVLAHHERWDGQGYPRGLKGEEIPEEARIIAVADALEAMTSDRPHRPARPFESALEEVRGCRGTQFDPDVVDAAESVDPAEWEAARERPGRPDHLRGLHAGYL